MFNNIFCEMKGKKDPLGGGGLGGMGNHPNYVLECKFKIYLDIQAITILYAFYWLFMC